MIVQPDCPTVRPNLAAAASKDLRRDVFAVSVYVRDRTNSACRRPGLLKEVFQMEFDRRLRDAKSFRNLGNSSNLGDSPGAWQLVHGGFAPRQQRARMADDIASQPVRRTCRLRRPAAG